MMKIIYEIDVSNMYYHSKFLLYDVNMSGSTRITVKIVITVRMFVSQYAVSRIVSRSK